MATLALTIAGSALGGPAGAYVGATIGAIIDNTLLIPLLPKPDTKGPRVNGFNFSGWEEGGPIARAFGTSCRIAGQVIYVTPIPIETENTNAQNGKGGSGGQLTEFTYSCHIAVAVCRGPITAIKRIWANGKIVYDASPDLDITDSTISGVASSTSYSTFAGIKHLYHLKLSSPMGGPDLGKAKVGKSLSLDQSPSLPAWNNTGNWKVIDRKTNPDGSSYVKLERREVDGEVAFTTFSAGSPDVYLHQSQQPWSQKSMDPPGPEIYLGTRTQGINTFFEQLVGTGKWPAYRDTVWVGFRNFQLFDYGNTPPVSWTFEIERDAGETYSSAMDLLFDDAGLTSAQRDTSAFAADALVGYGVRDTSTGAETLAPLMVASEAMAYERAGQMVLFKRVDAEQVTIPGDRLAAHELGQEAPRDVRLDDAADDDTPSQVVLTYIDQDKDNQTGTQRERHVTAQREVIGRVDIPVVISSTRGRELCNHILWTAIAGQRKLGVYLPPSQIGRVREGKLAFFNANSHDWKMLVTRVDRGANHMLQVEGIVEQPHLLELAPPPAFGNLVAPGALGSGTQHQTFTAEPMAFHVMDCASLRDVDQYSPGIYIAACLTSPESKFTGAALMQSFDGINYEVTHRVRQAATMGNALGVLGSGAVGVWDDVNTVDVELLHGEIENVREDACLDGANRFMIGGEIIGAQFATPIGDRTYTLSHLLRGLRDTESAMGTHEAGERVVLLTGPGIEFIPLSVSSIGLSRSYKLVTNGGQVDEFDGQDIVPQGENVKPFAPDAVAGARDGSNNLTIAWDRRTRAIVRLLSPQAIPLLEPRESYDVDVYDAGWTTVLRTITVNDATSASYSAANQTTDGLTPGNPVNVEVAQRSDWVRRGHATRATV